MNEKLFYHNGKLYEKIEGNINVGDLYYIYNFDCVFEYQNDELEHFDPNHLHTVKVKLLEN